MSHKLIANATRSPDGTYIARVIRAHDRVAIMTANGYPNAYAALDSARAHIDALDNPAPIETPAHATAASRAIATLSWVRSFIVQAARVTRHQLIERVDDMTRAYATQAADERYAYAAHRADERNAITAGIALYS